MLNLLQALVARDYTHFSIFERVFDRACQLAKSMGLHERYPPIEGLSVAEIERKDLIWALFVVDKQRVFIKGSSCHMYMFDCNIQIPTTKPNTLNHEYLGAYLKIVCLMEEIYIHLYSPKAQRQKTETRQDGLASLSHQLDAWWLQNEAILTASVKTCGSRTLLTLQLRYIFNITHILIHHVSNEEASVLSRLEKARAALEIVIVLCNGAYLFSGGLLALKR